MPYNFKYFSAVVFVALMGACSSKTETTASSIDSNRVAETHGTIAIKDTLQQINSPAIDTKALPARTIGEMILDGRLKPSDNEFTFRILDSLNTSDKGSRKFYFDVFNKIMDHSDGALSEAIGNYALTYVELNPAEFIRYTSSLPASRFETWASQVGIELFLSGNEPKENFQHYSRSVNGNCKGCSKATVQKLRQFNQLVWQTMEQNIKAEKENPVQ